MVLSIPDGIEVVPDSAVEVDYSSEGKEVVASSYKDQEQLPEVIEAEKSDGKHQPKILRLRRRMLWLFLVALIVIIASIVGGNLGGSLAGKHTSR